MIWIEYKERILNLDEIFQFDIRLLDTDPEKDADPKNPPAFLYAIGHGQEILLDMDRHSECKEIVLDILSGRFDIMGVPEGPMRTAYRKEGDDDEQDS